MALSVNDPVWAGEDDDDARIVRLARSPGGDALDLLYRSYAERVWRLCRSRLGSDADADDACQEALLRAHQALPRFRTGSPMWPWLATIAGNVCIDMRRTRRWEPLDEDVLGSDSGVADGRSTDPHDVVVSRLRHQLVGDALDGLPHPYRNVIRLRDLDGFSYAQIAELDDSTVASVRTSLHRGRRALRDRVRSLAPARGMWPLPAIGLGIFRPPTWLRRSAALPSAQTGAAVVPAAHALGAVAAVIAVLGVGAWAAPALGSWASSEIPAAITTDVGGEEFQGTIEDSDSAPVAAEADGGDPSAAPAPEPSPAQLPALLPSADASAGIDEDGIVTVTASVLTGENHRDGEQGRAESDNSLSVGCDMTDAHRAACDHIDVAVGALGKG
jgi:RNA polymerase sigma-70 factor (ECF subfamily)